MRVLLTFLLFALALTGCNLEEPATPTPVVTPDIPTVEFVYPERDARVVEGAELKIDLVARDSTIGVRRIELYLNGQLLNTAEPPNAPTELVFRVEMNWFANGIARHVLSAIAYRPDGTRSDETFLDIEVVAP
jgi:hypothetical protein